MFRDLQPLFYGPLANMPKALLIALFVWSLFWKGLTLWKAAKNDQKYWYIALLLINTLGVLEIIYLSFFQKEAPLQEKSSAAKKIS